MTITTYTIIMAIGVILCSLFTEGIKKMYQNANKEYSANIIALINALVIGIGGTSFVFSFMNIPFTPNNFLSIISIAFFIWIGSMVGFDKVMQSLAQIHNILQTKDKAEE